jgi:hypothetical protein
MEFIPMIFILIIGFSFVFLLSVFIHHNHEQKINEKIESIGGKVINIERRNFFSGSGPFRAVGKGRVVYRVEYTSDSGTKEGWVCFGGFFGPDWRL